MELSKLDIHVPQAQEELDALSKILTRSLFFPGLEQDNWIAREGEENLRVVGHQGRIVGGYAVQHMGQWFGGKSIPVGAVRAVGVAPDLRGFGISTHMLTHMLHELHDAQVPLASLYPSTQQVYRKVGFEQAGTRIGYLINTHDIGIQDRPLDVKEADLSDTETFRTLYNQRAQRTAGHLDRSAWMWEHRILTPRQNPSAYLFQRDGQTEGYVIYTQRFKKHIVDGEFHIRDMVIATPAAARGIWSFFAGQRSSIQRVIWFGGVQEPMFVWLSDQLHEIHEQWRWMLRLVDARAALQARGFAPHIKAELHLDIHDPLLPWNHGRFICHIEGGEVQVKPGGEGHIQIDIRALAAVFSGYWSATDALSTGLIQGEETHLTPMNHAFAGAHPWMPDMF